MGNIMNLTKLRNNVSRNGFDLSRKNLFTAKVGEMIPACVMECLPDDSIDIDTAWFTRTQPINTAAYTRMREYYDFYFVPTNLLWNKFNTFVTQMTDNNQKAYGLNSNVSLSDEQPYFTTYQIGEYINRLRNADKKNFFGFHRSTLTCKLLHYLGYGDFSAYDVTGPAPTIGGNYKLNPFKLLAFQKVYQDFVRDSQWEKAYAPACNIDYMTGAKGTNNLPISEIDINRETMFDMRYYNWNKDYFMGLLPNSQYGNVSSVTNITENSLRATLNGSLPPVGDLSLSTDTYEDGTKRAVSLNDNVLDFGHLTHFTVLALRQAEALQKWKEITQSTQQDYKSQMQAHWNADVSDAYSDRCKYLGGVSGNLDIQPVQNQNLTGDNDANIAGRGEGGNRGTIKFKAPVHGYLVCIYHAVPLLEYAINGIKKDSLKTLVTDYAIPEFDATGMVSVSAIELQQRDTDRNYLLGYAPRYYDYKVAYDEVHGAFYNGGLDAWVAPIDSFYLTQYFARLSSGVALDYTFFKVPSSVLNPIFGVDVDSDVSTDQLLVNCSFDIKAVRNLDRNGLPY